MWDPSTYPHAKNSSDSAEEEYIKEEDRFSNNTGPNGLPIDQAVSVDDPIFMKENRPHKAFNSTLNKTPVIGILTEPLRGALKKDNYEVKDFSEYISAAHVKYLEQANVKVVPISYNLRKADFMNLLSYVNGLYITGDSP